MRTALESPPSLRAMWPGVVPTHRHHNQCREGGTLQQHKVRGLFIHAQDGQQVRRNPAYAAKVRNDLRRLRASPGRACGTAPTSWSSKRHPWPNPWR